jgi:hypothetical protein
MVKRPRVGDRVIIPFGLRELEVEVYRVDGKGEDAWVTVELHPDSPHEIERRSQGDPMLTICRLRHIRPAA